MSVIPPEPTFQVVQSAKDGSTAPEVQPIYPIAQMAPYVAQAVAEDPQFGNEHPFIGLCDTSIVELAPLTCIAVQQIIQADQDDAEIEPGTAVYDIVQKETGKGAIVLLKGGTAPQCVRWILRAVKTGIANLEGISINLVGPSAPQDLTQKIVQAYDAA
jgi:hypothetical protein